MVASTIVVLFLGSYLLLNDTKKFLMIHYVISFATWSWLFWDYKMLQINKQYVRALGLSIGILCYGFYLSNRFDYMDKAGLVRIGATLPIFFLLLQKPLRIAFKATMKREPIVDKPAPSFADFMYIFFLLMTTLMIPFWVVKLP